MIVFQHDSFEPEKELVNSNQWLFFDQQHCHFQLRYCFRHHLLVGQSDHGTVHGITNKTK